MAKEKNSGRGQYGEVVSRLEQVVQALEGGELSLEESLDRFAEGINLVKQGETILSDAEKRIEQLLSEDGRTVPLKVPDAPEVSPPAIQKIPLKRPMVVQAPQDDDDVPF